MSGEKIAPNINVTHVTAEEYKQMYKAIKNLHNKSSFEELGLDPCNIENELDKVIPRS